jgi:hypothetical protein
MGASDEDRGSEGQEQRDGGDRVLGVGPCELLDKADRDERDGQSELAPGAGRYEP